LIRDKLEDYLAKTQIIHVTGAREYGDYLQIRKKLPLKLRKNYLISPFLDAKKLPAAFALADLIIARSGASTLVDITLAKKPAILIPLPWAAGNHQKKNAEIYARQDAVIKFSQDRLTSRELFNTIMRLLSDETKLKLMSKRIGRMAEPRAAQKIVNVITKELR
jgi:UDP-N-acetylglucosamine--N-acetylmuramyl-(pentapeptide) pyrophosphoryl-undecaprenol N-acetylglucosamine transferase